jgi:uncharacterized protein
MPWLTRDGEVLATVEVAGSAADRVKGLMGRGELEGALLLAPPLVLHTIAAPVAVDVAFCNREVEVIATLCLNRWRVACPRPRARHLVVARAGAFERWHLAPGDRLEIKGAGL